MTRTRPARRSRRTAAWATAALAAATVLGVPTAASASSSTSSSASSTATTGGDASPSGCVLQASSTTTSDGSTSDDSTTDGDGGSTGDGSTSDGDGSTTGGDGGSTGDGSTTPGDGSTTGGDGGSTGDGSTAPGDGSTSGGGAAGGTSCDEPSGGAAGKLTWAPPRLTDPITIKITSRTRSLKLKKTRDYVLDLPDTPVRLKGGLTVYGGHNVVLIGGEIDASGGRAMYLQQQTGTIHVEGVRVTGDDVHEGINVAQNRRGATVQLENIKIDRVNGSYSTHHADLLQVWAGPSDLRVDGFEGSSTYQGFFFQPTKFNKTAPDLYDLRNVVLRDASSRSAYLLWQSGKFPIKTQDVTVVRNPKKPFPAQVMWPKNGKVWADVTNGTKTTGSPLTGNPGTDYKSPGYRTPGVQPDPQA